MASSVRHERVPAFDIGLPGATAISEDADERIAAMAFDGQTSTRWATNGQSTGWLTYDFGEGGARVINTYRIYPYTDNYSQAPKAWTLKGSNDGTTWSESLDSRSNQGGWSAAWRVYTSDNSTAYRYYRLDVTENNGASKLAVAEMELGGPMVGKQFLYDFEVTLGATGAGRAAVWAAANDGSEDSKYWSDHAVQAVSVSLVGGGESNNNEIVLTNHETAATDSCTGLAVGTKYYCTVSRPVAGTVQVSIYTGGPRGTLVDTLSVSVDASRAWRYLYGCNSYNSASPSSTLTFDVEHLAAPVDRATDFYYNESWQVLEERRDGGLPAAQYLWDQRYIDAPVMRWRDADADAGNGLEETLYYCNDANMNVTALVDQASGGVVERNIYTSYGEPTFMDGQWQLTVVAGVSENGTASAVGNTRLFSGLPLDSETGLNLARERYDHPTLGGWTSRDPIPYPDGMNQYAYCGGDPANLSDPLGLRADSRCTRGCHAPGDRESAALSLGSSVARVYYGWSYASDLMENYLSRGSDKYYDETSLIARDLAAALQGTVDADVRSQLPEGAGAMGPGETKSAQISGTLANVAFEEGQLEASVRQPDSITYVATLRITRCEDGVNDNYHYAGSATGHLSDEYGYKDSPPNAREYAGKAAYKKLLLGLAFTAASERNLDDFTVTVDFIIADLEGIVWAE